jgi:hypothetical protein
VTVGYSPIYYNFERRRDFGDYARGVLVVTLIGMVCFFAIDFVSGIAIGKEVVRYAKVHDRFHDVTYTTDDDGNKTKHESWSLRVCVAGERFSDIDVSGRQYGSVEVGDHVRVAERYGGITGWSYGHSFEARVDPRSIPLEGRQ